MNFTEEPRNTDWRMICEQLAADATSFYAAEKVWDYEAYKSGSQTIKAKVLPRHGMAFQEVLQDIRANILPGSIHQHHKNYIAFPDKGSHVSAQYAAMLAALINQNLIAEDKSAPTGTYVEMLVVSWLRRLVDYKLDDAFPTSSLVLGGAFVNGGVLANTIGLLGARQRAFPESKTKGMQAIAKTPKIFIAGQTMSHYSHIGSSWWLGFGTDNLIEVACTETGRMNQNDLQQKIELCLAAGHQPVVIIPLAGDSRTNTVDDLPGIYKIAQKYNIWVHADACHGGMLAFDDSRQHNGRHILSYSDSMSIDPHKHLGSPYSNSLILFKNPMELAAIGSSTDITIAYGSNDIGQVTPFLGSRTFDALKLYAVIMQYGLEGLRETVKRRQRITRWWYETLRQSDVLMPLHEPELFAQAFSLRPGNLTADELSKRNRQLHDQLHVQGDVVVHKFDMCDYRNSLNYGPATKVIALGSLFGSSEYTKKDLREILDCIERTQAQLEK